MSTRKDLPIGVFDSGLGGLTVVKEIQKQLPSEHVIYLGDSARVPYGTRSAETIERYAWTCAEFLVRQGLKMLVVACNTASAVAINSLRSRVDVPVQGVITAGARAAISASKNHQIGVIGTAGTIASKAYPTEIAAIDPSFKVFQNPAPLLVPLAEEGWTEGDVPELAIRRYTKPLIEKNIDVLMLGCTHYPLLRKAIAKELLSQNSNAVIVDSATAMASDVRQILEHNELRNTSTAAGRLNCFVTDLPASFNKVAKRFLGQSIEGAKKVDIS